MATIHLRYPLKEVHETDPRTGKTVVRLVEDFPEGKIDEIFREFERVLRRDQEPLGEDLEEDYWEEFYTND